MIEVPQDHHPLRPTPRVIRLRLSNTFNFAVEFSALTAADLETAMTVAHYEYIQVRGQGAIAPHLHVYIPRTDTWIDAGYARGTYTVIVDPDTTDYEWLWAGCLQTAKAADYMDEQLDVLCEHVTRVVMNKTPSSLEPTDYVIEATEGEN